MIMANLFSNAYTAVETYSFNKTNSRKIDNMTDAAACNSALRKKQEEEKQAMLESEMINEEIRQYYDKLNEGVVNRYVKESQIPNNINRISNIAKEAILKDILFEVFYNSLLMDADFLAENCDCIRALTDKYVDDNGGFKVLDRAIGDSIDNTLLKKIKSVCESLALEVCSRKLKDSKEIANLNVIDFDMNVEEKEKLDYAKAKDLNLSDISDLVKNKVLTVVKDEKSRQLENSELIENIENDLKDNEDVKDEKSMTEAMNNIILNKAVIEESTLFDAIFRDTYQDFIIENVAIASTDKQNNDDFKEMSRNYDTEMSIDDALEEEDPVENSEVNMDLILTEAITKYTLMETLYTLRFENYTHDNIRKLTERMLNPVNESVAAVVESEDYAKNRGEFFKVFNKLKDDPSSDTLRDKLSTVIKSMDKDDCASITGIAKKQIEDIIEKNPKMKDKYTELSEFIDGCKKD